MLALMLLAAVATADPPLHFHQRGMIVEIHKGEGPVAIQASGLTPLDTPWTFNCGDPGGCILTIQGDMDLFRAFGLPCAYVDGREARPACTNAGGTFLQAKKVGFGDHTAQVEVAPQDGQYSGNIYDWTVIYTLYHKGR